MHDADLVEELAQTMPQARILDVPESGYVHGSEMGEAILQFLSHP
jgi:hypothetical protein